MYTKYLYTYLYIYTHKSIYMYICICKDIDIWIYKRNIDGNICTEFITFTVFESTVTISASSVGLHMFMRELAQGGKIQCVIQKMFSLRWVVQNASKPKSKAVFGLEIHFQR